MAGLQSQNISIASTNVNSGLFSSIDKTTCVFCGRRAFPLPSDPKAPLFAFFSLVDCRHYACQPCALVNCDNAGQCIRCPQCHCVSRLAQSGRDLRGGGHGRRARTASGRVSIDDGISSVASRSTTAARGRSRRDPDARPQSAMRSNSSPRARRSVSVQFSNDVDEVRLGEADGRSRRKDGGDDDADGKREPSPLTEDAVAAISSDPTATSRRLRERSTPADAASTATKEIGLYSLTALPSNSLVTSSARREARARARASSQPAPERLKTTAGVPLTAKEVSDAQPRSTVTSANVTASLPPPFQPELEADKKKNEAGDGDGDDTRDNTEAAAAAPPPAEAAGHTAVGEPAGVPREVAAALDACQREEETRRATLQFNAEVEHVQLQQSFEDDALSNHAHRGLADELDVSPRTPTLSGVADHSDQVSATSEDESHHRYSYRRRRAGLDSSDASSRRSARRTLHEPLRMSEDGLTIPPPLGLRDPAEDRTVQHDAEVKLADAAAAPRAGLFEAYRADLLEEEATERLDAERHERHERRRLSELFSQRLLTIAEVAARAEDAAAEARRRDREVLQRKYQSDLHQLGLKEEEERIQTELRAAVEQAVLMQQAAKDIQAAALKQHGELQRQAGAMQTLMDAEADDRQLLSSREGRMWATLVQSFANVLIDAQIGAATKQPSSSITALSLALSEAAATEGHARKEVEQEEANDRTWLVSGERLDRVLAATAEADRVLREHDMQRQIQMQARLQSGLQEALSQEDTQRRRVTQWEHSSRSELERDAARHLQDVRQSAAVVAARQEHARRLREVKRRLDAIVDDEAEQRLSVHESERAGRRQLHELASYSLKLVEALPAPSAGGAAEAPGLEAHQSVVDADFLRELRQREEAHTMELMAAQQRLREAESRLEEEARIRQQAEAARREAIAHSDRLLAEAERRAAERIQRAREDAERELTERLAVAQSASERRIAHAEAMRALAEEERLAVLEARLQAAERNLADAQARAAREVALVREEAAAQAAADAARAERETARRLAAEEERRSAELAMSLAAREADREEAARRLQEVEARATEAILAATREAQQAALTAQRRLDELLRRQAEREAELQAAAANVRAAQEERREFESRRSSPRVSRPPTATSFSQVSSATVQTAASSPSHHAGAHPAAAAPPSAQLSSHATPTSHRRAGAAVQAPEQGEKPLTANASRSASVTPQSPPLPAAECAAVVALAPPSEQQQPGVEGTAYLIRSAVREAMMEMMPETRERASAAEAFVDDPQKWRHPWQSAGGGVDPSLEAAGDLAHRCLDSVEMAWPTHLYGYQQQQQHQQRYQPRVAPPPQPHHAAHPLFPTTAITALRRASRVVPLPSASGRRSTRNPARDHDYYVEDTDTTRTLEDISVLSTADDSPPPRRSKTRPEPTSQPADALEDPGARCPRCNRRDAITHCWSCREAICMRCGVPRQLRKLCCSAHLREALRSEQRRKAAARETWHAAETEVAEGSRSPPQNVRAPGAEAPAASHAVDAGTSPVPSEADVSPPDEQKQRASVREKNREVRRVDAAAQVGAVRPGARHGDACRTPVASGNETTQPAEDVGESVLVSDGQASSRRQAARPPTPQVSPRPPPAATIKEPKDTRSRSDSDRSSHDSASDGTRLNSVESEPKTERKPYEAFFVSLGGDSEPRRPKPPPPSNYVPHKSQRPSREYTEPRPSGGKPSAHLRHKPVHDAKRYTRDVRPPPSSTQPSAAHLLRSSYLDLKQRASRTHPHKGGSDQRKSSHHAPKSSAYFVEPWLRETHQRRAYTPPQSASSRRLRGGSGRRPSITREEDEDEADAYLFGLDSTAQRSCGKTRRVSPHLGDVGPLPSPPLPEPHPRARGQPHSWRKPLRTPSPGEGPMDVNKLWSQSRGGGGCTCRASRSPPQLRGVSSGAPYPSPRRSVPTMAELDRRLRRLQSFPLRSRQPPELRSPMHTPVGYDPTVMVTLDLPSPHGGVYPQSRWPQTSARSRVRSGSGRRSRQQMVSPPWRTDFNSSPIRPPWSYEQPHSPLYRPSVRATLD